LRPKTASAIQGNRGTNMIYMQKKKQVHRPENDKIFLIEEQSALHHGLSDNRTNESHGAYDDGRTLPSMITLARRVMSKDMISSSNVSLDYSTPNSHRADDTFPLKASQMALLHKDPT
jgi:hypothetical protein